jgi:hypothetical protein
VLPTKFRFIWLSSYREEDYLEINQSETRIVRGGHVCYQIETKQYFSYIVKEETGISGENS